MSCSVRILPMFIAAVVLAAMGPVVYAASLRQNEPAVSPAKVYRADIRRTHDGIPHIKADDWGSLGYGYGYVQAQDNLCTLADAFVTYRGQRSAYFGGNAQPPAAASFGQPRNLDADFFFRLVDGDEAVARYRAAQPPHLHELLEGFAAGYNRYLDELIKGRFPEAHLACVGRPWIGRITVDDLYRRLVAINLAGGAAQFIEAITRARPPMLRVSPHTEGTKPLRAMQSGLGDLRGVGSNALAFGAGTTRAGSSLLFGNPHWFWRGPDRFYEAQLTIPGRLDVAGVSFLGVPVIVIGFNHDIAWTHTVSTARRFGIFELKLVPGSPIRYLYDGKEETLRAVSITVQVRDAHGVLTPVTRTLYRSRFGPMVDLSSLSPAFAWDTMHAFSLRDVNAGNPYIFSNFLAWGRAHSLDDFIAVQKRFAAMPWANTFAIGRDDPRVWFSDIGAVPNVPDSLADLCTTQLGRVFNGKMPGVPFLDGSRSACSWDAPQSNSRQLGTLPVDSMPSLLRKDYVGNFNGSYWLTNPQAPLTGFARVTGESGTQQSLRTRLGHALATELLSVPNGITRSRLKHAVLESTSMSERLFRRPLLKALCFEGTSMPSIRVTQDPLDGEAYPASQAVDLREACRVLRKWDGSANINARGANLWDEFWRRASAIPNSQLYSVQFDPNSPLTTPNGLNAANPALARALAAAVLALRHNDFTLNSPRGELLYTLRNGIKVPIYGGCDQEGYFTVACPEHPLDRRGYALDRNAHGNSYVQVVSFGPGGPEADTLLAHSQSDDPASPHYADATQEYSKKVWLRFPFSELAINKAPGFTHKIISGAR